MFSHLFLPIHENVMGKELFLSIVNNQINVILFRTVAITFNFFIYIMIARKKSAFQSTCIFLFFKYHVCTQYQVLNEFDGAFV